MEDRIFLASVIYLVLVIGISGFLPDSLYSGSTPTLNDDVVKGVDNEAGETEQFSYIGKVVRMLLIPFVIDDVPVFLGLIIFLINLLTTIIAVVYIYDKIRGIGG